MPNRSCW